MQPMTARSHIAKVEPYGPGEDATEFAPAPAEDGQGGPVIGVVTVRADDPQRESSA